tara:strand:+ start:2706 stop:3218 length:513 start_codon:yes stop_codon:yes gene_type:complete
MIKKIDILITASLNKLVNENIFLKLFLKLLTHTSSGKTYILYAILIPFTISNGNTIVKVGLLGFAFQVPVYLLSKNIIKRKRPDIENNIKQLMKPPDKYSFPSGHCASSTLLVLLINQHIPSITFYFTIWMLGIFFSRISLGLHYMSDVIGGALLGILSFYIANLAISCF